MIIIKYLKAIKKREVHIHGLGKHINQYSSFLQGIWLGLAVTGEPPRVTFSYLASMQALQFFIVFYRLDLDHCESL